MHITTGELLFYGGISGMVMVAAAALVTVVILTGSRKRLRRRLREEYGDFTDSPG
ncbi:MAG: hypothetical protein HFH89_06485 [Lachnospiraceae bacterium]|nr:hypothetical protein [uncultured Acetatifactor sp.]MCI8287292.1 hypothetical protein [Lachnospiraceae bacterium]